MSGLRFVDLFCGIGTIRMGMEQASHECVYSVEWDKHKRKIYSIIFGKEPEGSDIRATNARDIPRADVWCFGAPCQDFSIAGKRAGMEGEGSSLVLEVFRLIRETTEEDRPKYLIYENVKGMLSSNRGRDFLGILDQMVSLGYDRIEYSLLNSKDFGVPQNRERVFVVGHLRGRSSGKVFPLVSTDREVTANIKCLGNLMPSGNKNNSVPGRVYDAEGISPCLRTPTGGMTTLIIVIQKTHGATTTIHYNETGTLQAARLDKVPCVVVHNELKLTDISNCIDANYHKGLDNHGQRTGMIQMARGFNQGGIHEISPTLTKNSWEQNDHLLQNSRIRKLTPRECWRLQGIPDEITDKVIQAGISDTQMYRGAGDACTVNVIYEIAKKLT